MLPIKLKSDEKPPIKYNERTFHYFSDVRKYKVLDEDELRVLIKTAQNGNEEERRKAANIIVETNQRFIISAARSMCTEQNFNNLITEGTLGLYKAIEKFDLEQKHRFTTYAAFWIKKYIFDFIVKQDNIVIPKNANRVATYVAKLKNNFFLNNGRYPTLDEISDIFKEEGLKIGDKANFVDIAVYSIDELERYDEFNDTSVSYEACTEYYSRTAENNVEKHLAETDLKRSVNCLLSFLNERQRYVITQHYGIGCEPKDFETIARKLNIPAFEAEVMFKKAVKKLKKKMKGKTI